MLQIKETFELFKEVAPITLVTRSNARSGNHINKELLMSFLYLMKRVFLFILLAQLTFFYSCTESKRTLQVIEVTVNDFNDIQYLNDSLVEPVLYTSIPSLDSLSIENKKLSFISIVLPAVLVAQHKIDEKKSELLDLKEADSWSKNDSLMVDSLYQKFGGKDIHQLITRMNTHPPSIVLAQAAVESGWGTSRFFLKANNLFGVWSYSSKEPRVKAELGDMYLRKYHDLSASILDYYGTIARSRAYREFREKRLDTSDPFQLIPLLKRYSERGKDYVAQLKTIIQQNGLTQYDDYKIDPTYFTGE